MVDCTLSTQFVKPISLVIPPQTQHNSSSENYPLYQKKRKENGRSINETYFRALTKKSGRELGLIPNDDSMSINVPESAFPFAYTEPLLTSFFTSVSKTFPVSSV